MADLCRKRPVTVEVMGPLTADNAVVMANWCSGEPDSLAPCIWIDTLEGRMRADGGDFIIRGVNGEFYPCKPDIFAATYERNENTNARDERRVQVGEFVWKWHESVGWYDVYEDDPAMDTEIALLEEIERLRVVSNRLKQALLVTSNVWGQHHQTEDDEKYHKMVDAALDTGRTSG